ncbi:MAG: type II toxin-antitoxin system RelE/ParE family toxin, partial [Candidatus Omnitrophota bacterium]|nr:type II toxin-antitoxin system RelE/ParE family toxin [Candidatus Omnitrophota bacterium]
MKRYTIVFAPKAKKEVDRLPSKIKTRIANALDILAFNPFLGKALKADLKGLYSYRIGDYRIIYDILKDKLIIEIIKVMHRREVYR